MTRRVVITGLGKAMPATGLLFFLGGLALAGIPPTNGFISKMALFGSGIDAQQYASLAVIGVASILTLIYVNRAFMRIWWQPPADPTTKAKPSGDRLLAPALLIAAVLILGLWAEPLVALAHATAAWLGDGAWIAVGLAAAPSAWLWGRAATHFGGHRALMIAYVFLTLGVIIPAYSTQPFFAFLAAIMFGGTFLGIVGMSLAVGSQLLPRARAQALGILTIAFGIGQIIGPVLGGETANALGGYQGALLFAGTACAGGFVFTVLSYVAYRKVCNTK